MPPTFDLHDRTAVVTGATRGIGRGLAIGLGERGAHVIVTGRTTSGPHSLSSVSDSVETAGGSCKTFEVDHADPVSVHRFFSDLATYLIDTGRRLDLFVNNAYAGISTLERTILLNLPFWKQETARDDINTNESHPTKIIDDPVDVWDDFNNVGLRNNYICSVLATRLMLRQRSENESQTGGDAIIVSVSSIGGIMPLFSPAYGAGKAGVDRMSADFARQAPPGVKFITFWPGRFCSGNA